MFFVTKMVVNHQKQKLNQNFNNKIMNERISGIFKYLRRDVLAGIVTGVMAVPLTVGICLMSDYPVMTGLYTVIFAGVISFVTYLFKPGNYTGMPGVAAGLAPALALGVSVFGRENMPFVIMLTSIFQAIVWKFELEKYILKLVPHYLVEGLLAGVGIKIALKFIPFLYAIEHETNLWLNFEREVMIVLSIVSLVMFVMLYRSYQKNMPALPYFVIMVTSIGFSFFMPLPMLEIEHVPFELSLPLPQFEGITSADTSMLLLKMLGYAMMLGSIDVIEQVMSNVAIEKIDPLKRDANSNNSLLAIWVANLGSTFFGGMTNLDGLAKSTTNTVAGAITKFSNIVTSIFILGVVVFPQVLSHLPIYGLGIIMIYSGWKMIANIMHVRADGRYALLMSGICALLVYKLGIFEGLLVLLAAHAIIQVIFMKRVGKSSSEIWMLFKKVFNEEDHEPMEREDLVKEIRLPVLNSWIDAVNSGSIKDVVNLYDNKSVVLSTYSNQPLTRLSKIEAFYKAVFHKMEGLHIELMEVSKKSHGGVTTDFGHYNLCWESQGFHEESKVRFSMTVKDGKILSHHAGLDPEDDILLEEKNRRL